MKLFLFVLALFAGLFNPHAARASTLLGTSDFALTLYFDLKITADGTIDVQKGKYVGDVLRAHEYTSHSLTFRAREADFIRWNGNTLRMEWKVYSSYYDTFEYDFDTLRGYYDRGSTNLIDRYRFNGSDGSYAYETAYNPYPFFRRADGNVRRVSVLLSNASDPIPARPERLTAVPTPATLPLLITGLAGVMLLCRRQKRQ